MDSRRSIEGTTIQAKTPNWQPLLAVARELIGDFMWMFEAELDTGIRLHAYKHIDTRRYVHLDHGGHAYCYDAPGGYRPTPLARVMRMALEPMWDEDRPLWIQPEQIADSQAVLSRLKEAEYGCQDTAWFAYLESCFRPIPGPRGAAAPTHLPSSDHA